MATLNRRQLLQGLLAAPVLARAAAAGAAAAAPGYLSKYVEWTFKLPPLDPFFVALGQADLHREGARLFTQFTGGPPLPALLVGGRDQGASMAGGVAPAHPGLTTSPLERKISP